MELKFVAIFIQVIFIVCAIITIIVPPNKYCGVRFSYTLASENVWKKTNFFWGVATLLLVAIFMPIAIFEKFTNTSALYFFIIETCGLLTISLVSFFYARKLYFKEFPKEAIKQKFNNLGSHTISVKKSDIFLFSSLIIFGVGLFEYQYIAEYSEIWNTKITTHWGVGDKPNGWMVAKDSFNLLMFLAVIFASVGIIIGYFIARVEESQWSRHNFTHFTTGIIWGFAVVMFFGAINESIYASYKLDGKLSQSFMSGLLFFGASICGLITMALFLTSTVCREIKSQKKACYKTIKK